MTTLFGHPLHAPLVHLPLGLLLVTPIWDVAALLLENDTLASVAYYSEAAGLVSVLPAALFGALDLIKLKADSPSMKTGLQHAGAALASASLFVVAFALRSSSVARATPAVVALECLGALLLAATGTLGGRLVFHHRVGVRAEH